MHSQLSSSLIVSTASVAVLALTSALTIYFYSSYARPETLAPDAYEKEIFARVSNINEAVLGLKGAYKWNPFFSVPENVGITSTIEAEPELNKNPVSEYFDSLYERVKALATVADNYNDGINEDDKKIEDIKFNPRSIKFEHEIKLHNTIEEESSDKVIIKQVGLSLYTQKIHASIHRIQNLFGLPGLVGHLYIVEANKSNWDRTSWMKAESLDFSSKDKFTESLANKTKLFVSHMIFPDNKNQFIYGNGSLIDEKFIKEAVKPEEKELFSGVKDFINPYKWLYMVTRSTISIPGVLEPNKPIVVLVFTYKSGKPGEDEVLQVSKEVKYPMDVNLFPIKSLPNWDINIYEADEQRILNHSKTMLNEESTVFFDDL